MSRWEAFDKIWAKGKNNKMVQRLMAKCIQRKLEPTEDNCRDYWMGYIRYYKDAYSGQEYHINPRKHKTIMKQLKRNKTYDGKRRTKGKRKPSRAMGRRNKSKKRKV
tara:strand:- start:62 stop:382 length:321 start_codon:yes stop_codon:yes gene_type:complete